MTGIATMQFRGRWRDYQQEVLDALDAHLGDDRLHVIAAPGSGKTVLGLEAIRRIGRPTIVLSPSIAIRNQWADRLTAMFLDGAPRPDWLSTELDQPQPLMLITYQALLAAGEGPATDDAPDDVDDDAAAEEPAGERRLERLAAAINALGPATLVLDEAHHLRRQWWRGIESLRALLPDHRLVALTATPPYDVEPAEWQRYEALCGPSDAEVPVPRLVRNGDLCPHQDFVHFSRPLASEGQLLLDHRRRLNDFILALHDDRAFLDAIVEHGWMVNPQANLDAILAEPALFSSMLVFAGFAGVKPPNAARRLLGVGRAELPPMSADWMEVLLTGMVFTHADSFPRSLTKPLLDQLRALDVTEGKRVVLQQSKPFYSALAGSLAKLDGIVEIARAEYDALATDLRMIVLADHVRAADLPRGPEAAFRPTRLGVAPIFECLRRASLAGGRIAILSGSLVVIPASAVEALHRAAVDRGFDPRQLAVAPLGVDPGFVSIDGRGEQGQWIVQLVTALFEEGEILILVGTQALLGEGWDAPSANSLVLATYIGAYMASNQMRGRVIRRDPLRPDKVANVWHLASVLPDTLTEDLIKQFNWTGPLSQTDPIGRDLGPDVDMLKRRFQTFEGVSVRAPFHISSGLWRLDLAGRAWDGPGIDATNAETFARARDRAGRATSWDEALGGTTRTPRMRQTTRVHFSPRLLPYRNTLEALVIGAIISGLWSAINAARGRVSSTTLLGFGLLVLALTLFYAAPKLFVAARLWLRAGTIERQLDTVTRAVIDALSFAGHVRAPADATDFRVRYAFPGRYTIQVIDVTRTEESRILSAIEEVLGPVGNPRYLILRRSFLGLLGRVDYHAVPTLLAERKDHAMAFLQLWRRYLGAGELIFLRNLEGRKLLLKARGRAMANGLQSPTDRVSVWE